MDRCSDAVGLRNMGAKHANVSSHVSVCLSEIDAALHEEINAVKKDNSCQQMGNDSRNTIYRLATNSKQSQPYSALAFQSPA